ncbi:MAG: hypothetical protein JWO80_4157 [Bryobacterales bacterium]|nr:hypothetical protein [Bryobacterales bacterium]
MSRAVAFLCLAFPALAANPADWVPVRWSSTDTKTLSLLDKTPINCLLIEWQPANVPALSGFAQRAAAQGIAPLAVLRPGGDTVASARAATGAKMAGIVLEGDFPEGTASGVRGAVAGAPVIELTARNQMKLGGSDPVIGTYQGVWAGVQITDNGKAKAAPSGAAWIDTNTGFLRAVRAWGNNAVWLGNLPPEHTIVTPERYMQMIGDAGMVGARWVVALDKDFSDRLFRQDAPAVRDWKRITEILQYFETHRGWRNLQPGGQLAIVQPASDGGLLSGGILDMIAVKHTPVQAVPPQRLSQDALRGKTMAVNVDKDALDAEQKAVLTQFTRAGGTVLTGPPQWKDAAPTDKNRITLDDAQLKRIDDMWHDMQAMIGRKNLGVRLFNVSSMLSNMLVSQDGKEVYVQLVNYSEYPVENVTVHVLGEWHHAKLITPDGKEKDLEVYKNDEGTGVDIDAVGVTATVRLE